MLDESVCMMNNSQVLCIFIFLYKKFNLLSHYVVPYILFTLRSRIFDNLDFKTSSDSSVISILYRLCLHMTVPTVSKIFKNSFYIGKDLYSLVLRPKFEKRKLFTSI